MYAPSGDPDPTISELRELRIEAVAACEAIAAAAQAVPEGQTVELAGDTEVGIRGTVELWRGGSSEAPLSVTDDGQPDFAADLAPTNEAIHSAGNTTRAAAWFIAGLLSVSIAVAVAAPVFRP